MDLGIIVSGGDDSSLTFRAYDDSSTDPFSLCPATIVVRAHASAVTACSIFSFHKKIYVASSGNDQWVRLWEVEICELNARDSRAVERAIQDNPHGSARGYRAEVSRVTKTKISVADVSSMCIVDENPETIKLLICGVGMEVIGIGQTDFRRPEPPASEVRDSGFQEYIEIQARQIQKPWP
jgi:WD repeat-containing protein 6